MKHASSTTLEVLAPLLAELRCIDRLVERKPGIFYLRSAAFLHFHEDPAGLFADVKLGGGTGYTRLPVSSAPERAALLAVVVEIVASAGRR